MQRKTPTPKNKIDQITHGKINLPISQTPSQYIPQNSAHFVDHNNMLRTLAIAIRDNLPTLLIGESGVGKTSAIRYLAHQTKNGLRRVNLNGGTTADELKGRNMFNDKGTYWIDGILTEAMRNGDWIVLDEINAALPEVLFVLQSVLDDDGYIVLEEKDDKEIVYKHPNFRLFATCNPPEYAGTKEMNKALLSRFAICINAEFPNKTTELEIIEHRLGNTIAQSPVAQKLVEYAAQTRKNKELGTADYAINTRDILNTLQLAELMEPLEALALAFSNKLDRVDNNTVKTAARLFLPSTKKNTKTQTHITDVHELQIGSHYGFDADLQHTYLALTDQEDEYNTLINNHDISDILDTSVKEHAVKGDEFTIDATYYERLDGSASRIECFDEGTKVASAITITSGAHSGKHAIILHHPDFTKTTGTDTTKHIVKLKA